MQGEFSTEWGGAAKDGRGQWGADQSTALPADREGLLWAKLAAKNYWGERMKLSTRLRVESQLVKATVPPW